MTAIQRRDN